MFVNSIKMRNFRNHRRFECQLQRKVYIYGDNGTGKTSVLEGVYLALNLRTFRKQPMRDIIHFGETDLHITTTTTPYDAADTSVAHKHTLFYQDALVVKSNGEGVESSAQHLYDNPVVYYSPNTDSILSGEQGIKRKQLDKIIFHTDKKYATHLNTYNRLILQKRNLLYKVSRNNVSRNNVSKNDQTLSEGDKVLLQTLNQQLIPVAQTIYAKRGAAIDLINQHLEHLYNTLEQKYPNLYAPLYLSYSSNVARNVAGEVGGEVGGDVGSNPEIQGVFEREQQEGTPLYGTHRDRINIRKDGKLFEKFSSFGQGKGFHLVLIHSIRNLIANQRGITPITLLDDFEAGLDNRRIQSLLHIFNDVDSCNSNCGQVIMTGVNLSQHIVDTGIATINLNGYQNRTHDDNVNHDDNVPPSNQGAVDLHE